TIIQDYIEESWPTPALLPATPAQRARVRMIEEVMDTQYEAVVWGMMEVNVFGRAPGAVGAALLARAREQLDGLHGWLTAHLGDGDWFDGAGFGWGDIAVIPFVLGASGYGAGPAPGSALGHWVKRCLARATVAQTAAEAQAAAAAMTDTGLLKAALASGAFKREYRDHRLEWILRSGGIEVLQAGLAAGNIRFGHELKGPQ
ncbi:MAG: glutathione S-transferase family protein, partial [Polymorphobacter sp.]